MTALATPSVSVIGAGVSGLTSALELLAHGYRVTLHTAEHSAQTTSSLAAAIWHPFYQLPDSRYLSRARRTYARLCELLPLAASGVVLRRLTELFPARCDAPWWAEGLATEPVPEADLPEGYASAYTLTVPLADTTRYLDFLLGEFHARGGQLRRGTVVALDGIAAHADAVVNCTGYGAAALTGDTSLGLSRGLVVYAQKHPGVCGITIDDSDAARPTYIIERQDDVVLGGRADRALTSTRFSQDDVEDVIARCARIHPQVRDLRITGAAVGLRPVRPEVRLETDRDIPNLIHNYGHGGAGFTLSWGCAEDVVAGVDALLQRR